MIAEDRMKSLIEALRNGTDLETACAFAEVSAPEVYRMLELGKYEAEKVFAGSEPDPNMAPNLDLWQTLKKARADAIVKNVAYVQRAAKNGTWQAAAWWLERSVPETFGKRSKENKEQPKSITG
jgi:hypothetical protein